MRRQLLRSRDRAARSPLLRAAQDDPDAAVALFRAYFPALVTYMTRRVLDAELALDLASETFAEILAKGGQFSGATDAEQEAWMFAVARTQLTRFLRRNTVERRALQLLGVQTPDVDLDDIEQIENSAGLRDVVDGLQTAMAQLPPEQQTAIKLRVIDELGYAQVASRMGTSSEVARARVSRGLRALARSLDRDDAFEVLT